MKTSCYLVHKSNFTLLARWANLANQAGEYCTKQYHCYRDNFKSDRSMLELNQRFNSFFYAGSLKN
ncbi:hypothetical protein, partial [Shewanella sp. MF08487]|uniref:hypothetical protein n=1 Tax=Shewanella sp. MF08487 TaxID=3434873 RepID=UPI003D79A8BE